MVFETAFAVVVAIVRLLSSVSSDDTVRLWDVYSGKLKKVFNGHMSMGIDVLLSPDGQTIARASWDGTILLGIFPQSTNKNGY